MSVIGRGVIRLSSHRRPTLDDYLVFFSTLCLIAATGVFFADFEYLYLSQALSLDPSIALKTPTDKLTRATQLHLPYLDSYLVLLWTATFAVKFSFLAFFRQLVQSVGANMRTYFWIVVACTSLSWMFVIGEPFILCHYFGVEWSKYRSTE
jgi:hypothetical protein